jgi:mRNA-degrading endonuclease toxin of MazEF toxin-antitoxin module
VKDFDTWNSEKRKIEEQGPHKLIFHEREIWWCSLGLNIGSEEDGKNKMFERPVLVIKKFNNNICWILPMTSKIRDNKYHVLINEDKQYSVILSQIRLVSVKRFRRLIKKVTPKQFESIRLKLISILSEDFL